MNIKEALREYDSIRTQEKALAERKKFLADFIKNYATTNGTKDQNGSFYAEDDRFKFGSQVKKSVSLNFDRAKKFFTDKKLWDKVVVITESISEEKVEELIVAGEISVEEFEPLCDTKVSYSIDVKEKKQEEVPEVQVEVASPKRTIKRK